MSQTLNKIKMKKKNQKKREMNNRQNLLATLSLLKQKY